MPAFMGLKQKEVLVCCIHPKMQSDSDRLLLFSETETSYLVPQSPWLALVPVCSVSKKNNALIFAS